MTIMSRYYGLHKMKCLWDNKVVYNINVIIMNNLFGMTDPKTLSSIYDLKGSTYKRETS